MTVDPGADAVLDAMSGLGPLSRQAERERARDRAQDLPLNDLAAAMVAGPTHVSHGRRTRPVDPELAGARAHLARVRAERPDDALLAAMVHGRADRLRSDP